MHNTQTHDNTTREGQAGGIIVWVGTLSYLSFVLYVGTPSKHYYVKTLDNTSNTPYNENMDTKFWKYVNVAGPDECWNWRGGFAKDKYGKYHDPKAKKLVGSHRYAYEQVVGPIPPGMCILHSCDNPMCCNPAHLRVGTNQENQRDRIDHGRILLSTGEVMTLDDIGKIRELAYYQYEPATRIAKQFGFSTQNIRQIINEKIWKDIHPICKEPATHFVLSEFGGYFIPLCPAHKDAFDKTPRLITELGERDFPGCSFVL